MKLLKKNAGFSLIELMIAMVLGLMLSAGIFSVFSGNKRSTDLNSTLADMQESARFALNRIAGEIRMAGFQGCNDLSHGGPEIIANNAPTSDLTLTATTGYNMATATSWTPNAVSGMTIPPQINNAIPNTHALAVQFGSAATFPLVDVGGIPSRTEPLLVNSSAGISKEPFNLQPGEFAIVSNCTGGDLFNVTGVSGGGSASATISHSNASNTSDRFSFDYFSDASTKLMRFNSNVFYIGDTGETTPSGAAIRGLYQQSLPYTAPPILLIPGVENMRILFGVRTGTQTVSYVPAGTATINSRNIESVRIGLLMVSDKSLGTQPDTNTYRLANQSISASSGTGATGATHDQDLRFRQA